MSDTGLLQVVEAARRETAALLAIGADDSGFILKGKALRQRRRRIEWMRHAVQALLVLVVVVIGWQFARWVHGLEAGQVVGARPPGVEGFLPISGLLSLRLFTLTGVIHPVHPAALVLLLLALVTSFVVKKSFCSWLCPVGTFSEMLAALGKKIFGRTFALPRWLDLPLRSLQYLLLAFFAWAALRMTPLMLAGFLDSPYNKIADVAMLRFFLHLSGFALGVLAVLALASVVVPHFWCRYLCPYGALLGITSLLSPFKVTRTPASCIDCGLCAKACPAHLPVDRLARVRSAQCTGCLSCIAACPVESALRVEAPRLPGLQRPRLRPALAALLLLVLFFGGIAWARWSGHWRSSVSDAEYGVRIHEMDQPEYAHAQ